MGAGMSGVLSRRDLIVISGGAPRFMSDGYVGSIPWVGVFRDDVPGVNETGELLVGLSVIKHSVDNRPESHPSEAT